MTFLPTQDHNILLNPLPEILQALKTNSFGISPYPHSQPLIEETFPVKEKDVERLKGEIRSKGALEGKVAGRAKIGLADGGDLVVRLDQGGWTIESSQGNPILKKKEGKTFENLETLLIDVSPAYCEAMQREIWKRFEGHPQAVLEKVSEI